jgi:hypothetical protein
MINVIGAYGRKYDNPNFVLKDWESNKDFRITNPSGGQYINRADWIKYNKQLDSVIFVSETLVLPLEAGILP